MNDTELTLSGMGLPQYSARGLTQTLAPIAAAKQLRRTINGSLIDVSMSQFRKYSTTISAADVAPPELDYIWPGSIVTVGCVLELVTLGEYTAEDSEYVLSRPCVPGSIRHAGGYTFFRPLLIMLVTDYSLSADEWAAGVTWSLSLEEV